MTIGFVWMTKAVALIGLKLLEVTEGFFFQTVHKIAFLSHRIFQQYILVLGQHIFLVFVQFCSHSKCQNITCVFIVNS